MNITVVRGRLSRPAEVRTLHSGTVVVSLDITVRPADGPTETVPVAWFDPPAWAASLEPDQEVVVVGRVRRRFFRAGGGTQSRTEVVADVMVPARQVRKAEAALDRARRALAAG